MADYGQSNPQDTIQAALDAASLPTDAASVLSKIMEMIAYLQNCEALLIISIERAQSKPPTIPAPETGSAEFGWLPYLFEHANDKDSTDPLVITFRKYLQDVFGSYAPTLEKVVEVIGMLIDPKITDAQWQYLESNMGASSIIAGDGTIVGSQQYEDLDTDWLYIAPNYLLNIVLHEVAPFTLPATINKPFNGNIGQGKTQIKVAIIGDWGTGDYKASGGYEPASQVMQAVQNIQPDYIVHLGDVYYCGTQDRLPPFEEANNLLAHWPTGFAGKSFTLNSNHEMYGGAEGYFNVALKRDKPSESIFSVQNGYSFFALEYESWVFVGIDAAYHDTSALYMQGGIGTAEELSPDPQLEFLSAVATQYADKQIILMSHQTAMSTDGTTATGYPLLSQVQATGLTPDYWYWGHIHLGLVYGDQSAVTTLTNGKTKARCVGHSAIPFGAPWALKEGGDIIDFIAESPVEGTQRVQNGFAMLTLNSDGTLVEEFFNGVAVGSGEVPSAVWTLGGGDSGLN